MADVILATILLLGGLSWAFVCFMAGAMHPTGQAPWGGLIFGLAVATAGVGYWIWNVAGWMA